MRILCLHGRGTKNEIFESQTAALRYELDERKFTFDFVEGTVESSIAPEILNYYPQNDTYYKYMDLTSPSSALEALKNLQTFISEEGPYDGVLGFSEGAILAATYMIEQSMLSPELPPPFSFALFFSGYRPLDPVALREGAARFCDPATDGVLITTPTAHVWMLDDPITKGGGDALWGLCDPETRSKALHEEGHSVPGPKAQKAVLEAARVVRKTIDLATAAPVACRM